MCRDWDGAEVCHAVLTVTAAEFYDYPVED